MSQHISALRRTMVFLLEFLLYFQLFAVFFWLFSLEYPTILLLTRTAAITMVTFTVSLILLLRVYGGYEIGRQKSKPIISSLSLAILFTDLITYFQFSIMKTNQPLEDRFIYFVNPFTLLLIFCTQLLIIYLMVYLGNYLYFRITPPQKCCVIISEATSLDDILPKINRFQKQYELCEVIPDTDSAILDVILAHETVFLCDIPVSQRIALVDFCYEHSKNIYITPELCDIVAVSANHVVLDDKSFIGFEMADFSLEQRVLKRALDVLVSGAALLLTFPLMLLCAVAIKWEDRNDSILFRQQRATKDGKIFVIYKFRTMKSSPNAATIAPQVSARKQDPRITKVGKVLRKVRLDELPQFWNILKGDMSLVGPRPEMLENISRYTDQLPEFQYRLRVKAGLTGYAQIMGKYNTTPKDKLFLDLMYIENYSLWMDFKLLFQTLVVFFKTDSADGFHRHKDHPSGKKHNKKNQNKNKP